MRYSTGAVARSKTSKAFDGYGRTAADQHFGGPPGRAGGGPTGGLGSGEELLATHSPALGEALPPSCTAFVNPSTTAWSVFHRFPPIMPTEVHVPDGVPSHIGIAVWSIPHDIHAESLFCYAGSERLLSAARKMHLRSGRRAWFFYRIWVGRAESLLEHLLASLRSGQPIGAPSHSQHALSNLVHKICVKMKCVCSPHQGAITMLPCLCTQVVSSSEGDSRPTPRSVSRSVERRKPDDR